MRNILLMVFLSLLFVDVFCQNTMNVLPFTLSPSLVAIQVSNIDSSEAWYTNSLGFTVREKKEFPDYGLKISFLDLNGFELELVENKKSISRGEFIKNYPKDSEIQGFAKLTFRVDNIDSADTYLKKLGVKYLFNLQKSNIPDKTNQRWLIISDIDGNWIQLVSE
jgi:catechol 2,3-dioxygenase-like lactoylglutathione lyase family enzyme